MGAIIAHRLAAARGPDPGSAQHVLIPGQAGSPKHVLSPVPAGSLDTS
jgi:hypothetical protein